MILHSLSWLIAAATTLVAVPHEQSKEIYVDRAEPVLRQTPSPLRYADIRTSRSPCTRAAHVDVYTDLLHELLCGLAALQMRDCADPGLCRFAKRADLGGDPQAKSSGLQSSIATRRATSSVP